MSQAPPGILVAIISACCKPTLWESIEGDLHELFLIDQEQKGRRKAVINYFINAIAFLRYHRLRKTQKSNSTMGLMKNYVKVSFRDLKRNKVFTIINLTGLMSGMTVAFFMLQYVFFETNYDDIHEDRDRIYRIINDRFQNGELVQHGTITYPTIGPTMRADFPEVEEYTRMTIFNRGYVNYNNELFLAPRALVADEYFLSFFDFNMLAGRSEDNLDDPFELVMTNSFAESLLEADQTVSDLIGESVSLDFGRQPFRITGIVSDPPTNSHLQFNMLVSYKTFIKLAGEGADNSWDWSDFYHYVKLEEGADPKTVDDKLIDFTLQYFKQGEVSGSEEKFYLQSLSEAHLDSSMEYEIGEVTDGTIIWMMLLVAIFIIAIAWINYINLNTGRAIQRAKEVGIRKSLGARKRQIINQFFVETLILNVGALLISLGIVQLLQPFFNHLIGMDLSLLVLWDATIYGVPFPVLLPLLFITCLLLVAIYPSFLVTKFSVNDIIKGSFNLTGEITWLRKGLVVFQFCITIILITASITIAKQIDFMLDQDLGVDIENTMIIHGPGYASWDSTFFNRIDRFKNELSSLSGIQVVTASNRVLGEQLGRIFQVRSSADPEAKDLTSNFMFTDHDFSEFYGVDLLNGRDFTIADHNMDGAKVTNIIINESAVKLLKFESGSVAVGKTVNFWNKDWTVIGVIKDFHQQSLHRPIEPIFFIPYYETGQYYSLKFNTEPNEGLIERIQETYDVIFPGNYFDYFFLKDNYLKEYEADLTMSKVAKVFTFLSILIASLGLYGLILIAVLRKTKEIGVRKVLGASLNQILFLLAKEFLVLIGIAALIGIPAGYFLMTDWQENYAYTLAIQWENFLIAGISISLIALLVVVLQVRKISGNDPIESLRYE